jgi:hypothetical protein
MMNDFVIIVQGSNIYVEQIKEALTDLNVIFSTWVGEEEKYCKNDNVIFNEIPNYSGPANLNYQKVSTLSGLKKAKELGYNRALKLRGDIIPTNINELIKLFNNNSLNFLCWHCHEVYPNCPGYLIDYLMSGNITNQSINYNTNNLFSGVYWLILENNNNIDKFKFIVTK